MIEPLLVLVLAGACGDNAPCQTQCDVVPLGDAEVRVDGLGDAFTEDLREVDAQALVADVRVDTERDLGIEVAQSDTFSSDTSAADTVDPCPEDTVCHIGDEKGFCAGGSCVFACGDGFVQTSVGEQCDDENLISGDGCRDDCVLEEPIGEGFTGGQCQVDADCSPAGSLCIPGAGGGSCALPCTSICSDQPGSPVTFCIAADAYDDGMNVSLPAELYPALCVSKSDFELYPRTGCRAGFHGELHNRYGQAVQDEVCVPGPWHIGLAFSDDGEQIIGADVNAPAPAEPYLKLLELSCGGAFEPVDATLFQAMATTLLAMGPDGRATNWERLCAPAVDLPNVYGLHDEITAGAAFRLVGNRTEIVDWTAAGVYGSKKASDILVGGPLYPVRSMVYADGGYYLYADAADDHPYDDPERGRTFGMVDGVEWGPLDAEIAPGLDYVTIKANGGARFYRAWGRMDVIAYVADMSIDHLITHGEPLGVGDLSLPTGGDIDDHASHELGRDVDLYLVTQDAFIDGVPLGPIPWLWVSQCKKSGGWSCHYWENATGAVEDLSDPQHTSVKEMLITLAQYAYDNPGPTRFVQHDVSVLQGFIDLPGSNPVYVHAGNDDALGWPPHQNHIHIRF